MYNALTLTDSNLDEIYIIRKYDVIRNIYMGLLFINLTKTLRFMFETATLSPIIELSRQKRTKIYGAKPLKNEVDF